MTCAQRTPQPCIERETRCNVRCWVATAPVGAGLRIGRGTCAVWCRRYSRAQPRCEISRHARGGLPHKRSWSCTAVCVLLSLGSIDATSSKGVYEAVKRIDWRQHIAPGATLAQDCSGGNESIRHTIYGSQLLKDAVCDNLRDSTGERPNIKPECPDVLLHLHVEGPMVALVSLDFSSAKVCTAGATAAKAAARR